MDHVVKWLAAEPGYTLAGHPGTSVSIQAYADDIVIVAASEAAHRAATGKLEIFLRWARLDANASKCAALIAEGGRTTGKFSNKLPIYSL
ncbi:hypothetical protein PAPYR_11381 [Paratrimastix pyriformis]|uniref:Reverse transcriptase domain-containing protein n=1 Tax=Paratrimastix pyriformis TaxID=342808 RepID=A0ABQ8U3W7_9EUKA|nr:hypothetical protein PAPYR_11381 [Paratrimastix pyriformis]